VAEEIEADSHVDELMTAALEQAALARDAGEVPVGAVIAIDGEIVGRGFNQPISSHDPTAHAEIVAIRDGARRLGNYRLTGATLCVTIEPCLMCVGAMVHARIAVVVFGAPEPRTGAVVSTVRAGELPGHNHRFEVVPGVREDECRELMQTFFRGRRGSTQLLKDLLPPDATLDQRLRLAIAGKRLVEVRYDGNLRLAEPHDYGIRNGVPTLLAYQLRVLEGPKKDAVPGWRWLDLAKIEDCIVSDVTFPGSRGDASQRHHEWDELFARVA
jgi:tRNA(adenine34) deaminase